MATVTIAARSRKNGKSYVVQYVDPDTGRKKHHGTYRRRDLAQQEANKLRVILDDGKLPETRKQRRERVGKTFGDVAELCRKEWQRRLKEGDLSPSTVSSYMTFLKPLEKHWGTSLFAAISRDDVLNYRADVAADKSKILANRRLFIVKQVYAKARDIGCVSERVAGEIHRIRYLSEKEHERKSFMYPDMVDRMLKAAHRARSRHYLPLAILLAVEHGASRQEVLDLKWDDVDLDYGKTGLIRFTRTKTRVERTHQIMPRTRKALLARKEYLEMKRRTRHIKVKGAYVVGHLDGTRKDSFKSAWKTVCRKIGMPDFHFHDNRHTFYSNILMAGGTLKHAKEMIGHKTLRMTDRYSHLEAAHDNPIQAILAKHYENAS